MRAFCMSLMMPPYFSPSSAAAADAFRLIRYVPLFFIAALFADFPAFLCALLLMPSSSRTTPRKESTRTPVFDDAHIFWQICDDANARHAWPHGYVNTGGGEPPRPPANRLTSISSGQH